MSIYKKELQLKDSKECDLKCLKCFPKLNETKHSTQISNARQKPKGCFEVNKKNHGIVPLMHCHNIFKVLSEDNGIIYKDYLALNAIPSYGKIPCNKKKATKVRKIKEISEITGSLPSKSRLLI